MAESRAIILQIDPRLEKANLTVKAMKAIEVMATVDEQGQLSLDLPLSVDKYSRVRVIILVSEEAEQQSCQEDKEISESAIESFRQGWHDAMTGNTLPVSQLWEGIDAE
ncbi:hypothetical protein [Nodularia chucula]|uniref:type II toxin-antitoxin system RelN family antitoxin n=1 Tax=Nodularia chucula TaxID=3093667 RepID=UPI0039C6D986